MLLIFLLSIVYNLLDTLITWFINALPQINIPVWSVPSSMQSIISVANYFLPMNAIWLALQVIMGITLTRIVLAILLRIKSFIPLISG